MGPCLRSKLIDTQIILNQQTFRRTPYIFLQFLKEKKWRKFVFCMQELLYMSIFSKSIHKAIGMIEESEDSSKRLHRVYMFIS